MKKELQDWSCVVNLQGKLLTLLCCPEDKTCQKRCKADEMCTKCRVPVCNGCRRALLWEGKQPAAALSNDMMVYYAPQDIFEREVTVMEMLCASPCLTTMVCFSLEQKLRGDRALDQDQWMNRNRLVARGNATTFPLAWEDLLQQMQNLESGNKGRKREKNKGGLPHCGEALRQMASVIVKSAHAKSDDVDIGRVIHQARVRRQVVVQLIEAAVERGHPAFQHVEMEVMYCKAAQLPEDAVPEEVIAVLPLDNALNQIIRQKAATPVREAMPQEFRHMMKPNAVVAEKTSVGLTDVNASHVSALQATATKSSGDGEEVPEYVLRTGNRLLDQFQPKYFGIAFPYVFKYCTGMPDPPAWSAKARFRRHPDAPRVELADWVKIMARRCEAHVARDWVFGFSAWNLHFRSALNLSRNVALFDVPVYDDSTDTWRRLKGEDIEAGAQELLKALRGQYIDRRGRPKAVNMDISKLQYVRGLRPAARKLVKNMRHTAQELPGTQEAPKRMRFEIEGMRIRFGVPLFVTFSPDEAHQMLYVRMARARCSDPVRAAAWDQDWNVGDRDYPPVDNDTTWPIHVETFRRLVPGWDLRRQALARDPLASVDGFRMIAMLVLEHLFGVKTCPACPDCNHRDTGAEPCQDDMGSNATVVGGVFGRMDAAYITIEAQKSSGSLHGHCQCFVQCLHQHTQLQEIFQLSCERLAALRAAYLEYNAHVMHGTYAGQDTEAIAQGIADAEAAWPEHKDAVAMIQSPPYQQRRMASATSGRRGRQSLGTAVFGRGCEHPPVLKATSLSPAQWRDR